MGWPSRSIEGGTVEGAREESSRCNTPVAYWSRYAFMSSSDTTFWGSPSTADVFPFANSKELKSLEPYNTLETNVSLARRVESESVVTTASDSTLLKRATILRKRILAPTALRHGVVMV